MLNFVIFLFYKLRKRLFRLRLHIPLRELVSRIPGTSTQSSYAQLTPQIVYSDVISQKV